MSEVMDLSVKLKTSLSVKQLMDTPTLVEFTIIALQVDQILHSELSSLLHTSTPTATGMVD
jgi:hypothetical protein